ncbi:MAG: sigma-70 family RNA polymerase sigma factor [Bacteroidales bacterium]|nr:sigma-70 family RNA polymerase sigma factor [Bacteroidales bacterium]MCM1415795.1 sigma-70 family RNA polymerase sigma factor [bacterium]MCM1422711.1 sigma-70 family RNA polymerase sigma factor [bacterium]
MTKEEQITAEAAVDRYADMVYRLALTQMKNRADADDLFQEVFVRLVSHIGELQSWEHVKAWLIRVTINCAKKHFALYWNKNVDYLEDEEKLRGEEAYEPPEEHPVRGAVQKLPPKYRAVVHLFYYEELSVAEIAASTGQKESTVKSQLHRAREMLKELLREESG